MCFSRPCYSHKLQSLYQKCNVQGKDADDPFVQCKNIQMKSIQEMVHNNKKANLNKLNQYNVQNHGSQLILEDVHMESSAQHAQ